MVLDRQGLRGLFGPPPVGAAVGSAGPPVAGRTDTGLFRTGLASFDGQGKLRACRSAPLAWASTNAPEGIRRREQSLVALMDYRRRSGFDKANLAIAWAKARRPRPCVNSFSSLFWWLPLSSGGAFVNGPGLQWVQTRVLDHLA